MSDCTLGRYNDTWITGGTFGSVTACTCPNCTEREATVQAEANAPDAGHGDTIPRLPDGAWQCNPRHT